MNRRYWLAFSGGLDSQVLLHFLATQFPDLALQAIHINHQLLPQAQQWEVFCKQTCDKLQIPLKIIRVNIQKDSGLGLEAAARQARYAAFTECLKKDDILFTAHHLDDQAETVLLQLFRGAGLRGVSAMQKISALGKGYLVRPLLAFSREDLAIYAQAHQLTWIEDPSNQDTNFRRNFLRQQIIPELKQHWPKINQTLSRFAEHCFDQEKLLQEIAEEDLKNCQTKTSTTLSLSSLLLLSSARQVNVLRYWMRSLHFPVPPEKILQEILATIFHAKQDANPCVKWQKISFRRYNNELFIVENTKADFALNPSQLAWCKKHLPYDLADPNIRISYRQGGEKFRPANSKHTRTLKNLFQEWQIPPWQRGQIPLIYYQNKLVAVIGYDIDI